mgnify:CR=1 FL=1
MPHASIRRQRIIASSPTIYANIFTGLITARPMSATTPPSPRTLSAMSSIPGGRWGSDGDDGADVPPSLHEMHRLLGWSATDKQRKAAHRRRRRQLRRDAARKQQWGAEAGMSVAAVVDLREVPDDKGLLAEAIARGITVHMGATVYTARRGARSQSLCGVDIHRIDTQGEVGELIAQTDCAVLAMSAGFMPSYQLACQAGAKLDYDDGRASHCKGPEREYVNDAGKCDAGLNDQRRGARRLFRRG